MFKAINQAEKKVLLVLGKRGSGKSFLLKQNLKTCNRFLIYDTLGEYNDGIIFQDPISLCEFWSKHLDGSFRIIYQPLQPVKEFDRICDLVFACGDMVFVVEELDQFSSPMASLSPSFANIVQRGRHRDLTFIGVSQRPFGISRMISAQAKEIYTFNQTEPRDIDYLSNYIGEANAEKLPNIPLYNYLRWTNDGKVIQSMYQT